MNNEDDFKEWWEDSAKDVIMWMGTKAVAKFAFQAGRETKVCPECNHCECIEETEPGPRLIKSITSKY